METSRSNSRRLLQSYVSTPRPDLPAIFESLNDDTLTTVLEFVGDKSYAVYAMINKHCKEIYLNTPGMTKKTFLYGYAPLSVIQNRIDSNPSFRARIALCKGVVFYNRSDVLAWLIQEQNVLLLNRICGVAAKEGRIDLLNKVLINVEDEYDKREIFESVDWYAARGGKLNVLKWVETKGLSMDKDRCARGAAYGGHLHIIQWLREEKGLQLDGYLYNDAIDGDHLHVMKWLREQGVDWDDDTFYQAAEKGNLDILQWLHDEGCPWSDDYHVPEIELKPEVVDWCRTNGYGNKLLSRRLMGL